MPKKQVMPIHITKATIDDAPMISAMLRDIASGLDCYDTKTKSRFSQAFTAARIAWHINLAGGFTGIAKKGKETLGFLHAMPSHNPRYRSVRLNPSSMWISWLMVAQDGRQQGTGTALLQSLEDRCSAKGFTAIEAAVYIKNDPSLSFFAKHGFSRAQSYLVEGDTINTHQIKQLSRPTSLPPLARSILQNS